MRAFLQDVSITILLAAFVAGCGDYRAINDDNVEFQRAEKARTEGKLDVAVRHYRECLRLAPGSYKAHLQLALIFEDHHEDLPQAIVHYQAYLTTAPAEDLAQVQRLLDRAQEKYYRKLEAKLGSKPEEQPVTAVVEPAPDEDPSQPPPEPTVAKPDPNPPAPLPVPVPDDKPEAKVYVVKSGDTLTRISKRLYGTTRHADAIFEANRDQLASPDRLKIGQSLNLPAIEEEVNTTDP